MLSARALEAGRAVIKLSLKSDAMKGQLQRLQAETAKISEGFRRAGAAGLKMASILAIPMAALVKKASSAQEQLSKFKQVFGEQTEAASKFAQTLSRDVGRSVFDVKNGLATFQSFFTGLGFSADQSRQLSQQLQALSIDFASFHDLTDDEALQRFISALSGSSEVLDRFGVNIKQAALQQELLREGIHKSWSEVTEQEKAIARLNVIMRAMGEQGAVGDAKRTAGSFANQMKALRGQIADAAVELGEALLPMATQFVVKAREIASWVGEWARRNQALVAELGTTIAKLGALSLAIYGVGKAFDVLSKAIAAARAALLLLTAHPLVAALTLLAGAAFYAAGGFDKLADMMGLSAKEATKLAKETEKATSAFKPDVIKRYNDELERFRQSTNVRPRVPYEAPARRTLPPGRLRSLTHPHLNPPAREFDLPYRPTGTGTRANMEEAVAAALSSSAAMLGGLGAVSRVAGAGQTRQFQAAGQAMTAAENAWNAARAAFSAAKGGAIDAAEKSLKTLDAIFGGPSERRNNVAPMSLIGNKQFAQQILGGGQDEQVKLLAKIEKNTRRKEGGLGVA